MGADMLQSYLETMRFLSDTSDTMMYLCDLASEKIYFADNYAEKLQLSQLEGTVFTLEELQKFLFSRNGEQVRFRLDSFDNLENGLLHQEYWFVDKFGKKYKIHCTERLQRDEQGRPMWIIGQISNVAASKKVDPLTRLYNAQKLIEDLTNCIDQGMRGCLIVLGIDNFKNINNKYGREFGDRVLLHIAEILDQYLQQPMRAYRMDSDMFAINALGSTREDAEKIYRDIRELISDHYTLSSGVAQYSPDVEENADLIYQQAENALDLAKKNGKNKLEFFSQTVYKELLLAFDFQEELKESVAAGCTGFSLCYQPLIDLEKKRIYGVEALLRYHSKLKGPVPPNDFIPILEQTELIIDVGAWVMRNALIQCKKWREHLKDLRVNVNLSFVQLRDPSFLDTTLGILDELSLPGDVLTLELTESVHLQNYQFFNKIFYKLEKYGIKIAIDDFGTGYSSLGYIKSIAIDEIKIDRSFVSGIQFSSYNYRLLSNLIELAHSADIRVCCEGVETAAELNTLRELHPDVLQGYLFGKPQRVEEFERNYILSETEDYRKTRTQEQLLFAADEQYSSEIRESAQTEKIATLIDRMEEIVYVSERDSYELTYLNATGRELTGMYDYKGRKCYEILQGRRTPCEFCPKKHVGSSSYYVWEWDNHYLHRHFLVKEKLIQWTGRNSLLTVCIDITEKEVMSREVQEKLEFVENIISCTKMLVNEPDQGKAINGMLSLVGNYYDAKRAFVCNIAKGWKNTYEWCADGVVSPGDTIDILPKVIVHNWRLAFQQVEFLVIEDVEHIREIAPKGYQLMTEAGISSLIVSPVRKNKDVVGFIIVVEPQKHKKDSAHLETMAYFLADRLTRNDTRDQLEALLNQQQLRQTQMYNAFLSETLSYAEIDLDSGKILNLGGLWKDCCDTDLLQQGQYKQILNCRADELIDPQDLDAYRSFLDLHAPEDSQPGLHTRRIQVRRKIDGVMRQTEVTVHFFHDPIAHSRYCLIYMKKSKTTS